MKFLFKQRLFSWFDSYDIYDEAGNPVYIVRGQLAWGHCLKIFDAKGHEPGAVKERVIAVLPWFEIYEGDRYIGCIRKELTLLKPKYDIDYLDWHVEGNLTEWDYEICGPGGETVAQISKQILHLTDTYILDIENPSHALSESSYVFGSSSAAGTVLTRSTSFLR